MKYLVITTICLLFSGNTKKCFTLKTSSQTEICGFELKLDSLPKPSSDSLDYYVIDEDQIYVVIDNDSLFTDVINYCIQLVSNNSSYQFEDEFIGNSKLTYVSDGIDELVYVSTSQEIEHINVLNPEGALYGYFKNILTNLYVNASWNTVISGKQFKTVFLVPCGSVTRYNNFTCSLNNEGHQYRIEYNDSSIISLYISY